MKRTRKVSITVTRRRLVRVEVPQSADEKPPREVPRGLAVPKTNYPQEEAKPAKPSC